MVSRQIIPSVIGARPPKYTKKFLVTAFGQHHIEPNGRACACKWLSVHQDLGERVMRRNFILARINRLRGTLAYFLRNGWMNPSYRPRDGCILVWSNVLPLISSRRV